MLRCSGWFNTIASSFFFSPHFLLRISILPLSPVTARDARPYKHGFCNTPSTLYVPSFLDGTRTSTSTCATRSPGASFAFLGWIGGRLSPAFDCKAPIKHHKCSIRDPFSYADTSAQPLQLNVQLRHTLLLAQPAVSHVRLISFLLDLQHSEVLRKQSRVVSMRK